MHTLQAEAQDSPAQAVVTRLLAKLPQLLPAVGSTWRPTTSNAAARFLGAFERFYRCKGPFQNVASAHKHVALFMLGYVFETFSAEAAAERQGRCPLQLAGYEVGPIPLFHLLRGLFPELCLLLQIVGGTHNRYRKGFVWILGGSHYCMQIQLVVDIQSNRFAHS